MSSKFDDDNPFLSDPGQEDASGPKTQSAAGEVTTDFRVPAEDGPPPDFNAPGDAVPGDAAPASETGFPAPDDSPGPRFGIGPDAGGFPSAGGPTPSKSDAPPLFTGWQVGLASMLATPLAGFILLAMNFFRRNQGADGWVMLLPGLIVFVGINAFPFFLPLELNIALALLLLPLFLFGMRQFDYDLFGAELVKQEEEKRGGGIVEIILVVVGVAVVAAGIQYLLYSQWNMGLFPWVQSLTSGSPAAS